MILALLLVAGMAGAGTWAYFSDTESSTVNTFQAGTFDLNLRDDNEDWSDGVTASWAISNMKPGQETYGFVDAEVFGSVPANHLEIACDYTVTEESPAVESDTDPNTNAHPDEMAKCMVITYARYQDGVYDIDLLTGHNEIGAQETKTAWQIKDVNNDGRITLYDFKRSSLNDLPLQPQLEQFTLKMKVKFDENSGNDFQGDTLNATLTFTANQDASQ